MNYFKVTISLVVLLSFVSTTSAEVVIDVGDHVLLPGTANQQINILVTSSALDPDSSGANINAEIGDGIGVSLEPTFQGPFVASGNQNGATSTGTIYESGGPVSGFAPASLAFQQLANIGTSTPTSVDLNGVFITFIIDTTSVGSPGDEFPFRLGGFATPGLGDTEILGPIGDASPIAGVIINNGTIRFAAIPEPSTALFMIVAGCGLTLRRRRF